jgi:hypothetical protein
MRIGAEVFFAAARAVLLLPIVAADRDSLLCDASINHQLRTKGLASGSSHSQ